MYKYKDSKEIKLAIEKIEQLILTEKLKPNEALKPIEALSSELHVSQYALEKAFKIMEVSGLLKIKDQQVSITGKFFPNLLNPVSMAFIMDGGTPGQVFEARKFTECFSASVAAERRTEEQVDILKTVIDRMASPKDQHADKDFHFVISKMTGNKLLYYQTLSMVNLTDVFIDNAMQSFIKEYTFDVVFKIHHDIFDAIKKRDTHEAYHTMQKHFDLLEKFYE